jgi:L-amino acid N-acyltransferase YncA
MRIRLAEPDDLGPICAIYNTEVTESLVTFDIIPWEVEEQRVWLDRHKGAHPAIVAVDEAGQPSEPSLVGARGEPVLGYGSLSPFKEKPAYATTVENSVYVARSARRRGVGKAILEELIRLAGEHGFHAIIARTEGSNTPSTDLHLACGFEVVGVEREVGRKHGRWLDVIELQRMV